MSTGKNESHGNDRAGVIAPRRRSGMSLASDPSAVPNLAGKTVLVIGHACTELRQMGIWVDQFGGLIVATHEPLAALRWLEQRKTLSSLVIFEADDFEDANDVVTFGFALRMAAPNAPTIMLSSQVKRNDFSSTRMMICDATLKSPVTLTGFCMGLEAAQQNHAYYVTAIRPLQNG